MNIHELNIFSYNLRRLIIHYSYKAKTGHIGSNLSIVEIISVVFNERIYNKKNKSKDKFILSKGHASIVYFCALLLLKKVKKKNLDTIFNDNSLFGGHITANIKDIIFSTGSLGHGLPYAAGLAFASIKKKLNEKIFVVISDGELNEGSTWETLMISSHHNLGNLFIILDNNKLQALGPVEGILNTGNLKKKFKSFELNVYECNGHNKRSLKKFVDLKMSKKPNILIANTIKGYGIDFMENKLKWHYNSLNSENYNLALKNVRYIDEK